MMKQLQFYKYAVWGLLVLNLSMVAFFFLTRPKHPGPPMDRKGRAETILKLNEQQHDVFLKYAEQHIQQMEDFEGQQSNLLKPYFSTLLDEEGNLDTDSLLTQFLQVERKKIETTYLHFQDIRSILKPGQETGFEEFMDRVLKTILVEKNNPLPLKRGGQKRE